MVKKKIPKITFFPFFVKIFLSDFSTELGDVKASIAALTFILSSAAKYHCDGETLSNELQQLGLPKGKRERERGVLFNKFQQLGLREREREREI